MGDQRQKTRTVRRHGVLPRDRNLRLIVLDSAAIAVIGILMAVATGMAVIAMIIAGSTLAIIGLRLVALRQSSPRARPRCLSPEDLDGQSQALLQRAVTAINTITSSQVFRDGVIDRTAVRIVLADQQRDITIALREQARLRARRAEVPDFPPGPMTAEIKGTQTQAAELAESSLAARVRALERYAAEIREADAAYQDWQQAGRLADLQGQHLDMLARTAADEHWIAEIEAMSQQARAIRLAFREPRPSDPAAQRTTDPVPQAETPDPPPLPPG
jgi:hypothetical protein